MPLNRDPLRAFWTDACISESFCANAAGTERAAARRKSSTFFIVHSPRLSPEFSGNPTGEPPAGRQAFRSIQTRKGAVWMRGAREKQHRNEVLDSFGEGAFLNPFARA